MRVLAVEDDDAIASALEIGLKREGFDTVRAGSAAQALNSLPVDFILLDLGLLDRDDLKLFHNLRAVTTAPIIMVSTRGFERNKIEGLDVGADDRMVDEKAVDAANEESLATSTMMVAAKAKTFPTPPPTFPLLHHDWRATSADQSR